MPKHDNETCHPAHQESLAKVKAVITGNARKLLTADDLERIAYLRTVLLKIDQVAPLQNAEERREWAREKIEEVADAIANRGALWDAPVDRAGHPDDKWNVDPLTHWQRVLHEFSMHMHRLPDDNRRV